MSCHNFEAFTYYYHQSCDMVYGYCLHETGNPLLSEKLLEAAYKQLWQNRRQLPAVTGRKWYILLLVREHLQQLK